MHTGGSFLQVLRTEIKHGKPFLTYIEQADLLISRGLMADREELVGKLERVGYHRFSGYLHPYKQSDGTFREGTTLDEVWGRYTFDRQFRPVMLNVTKRVEVWFRSQLAHELKGKDGAFGARHPTAHQTDGPRINGAGREGRPAPTPSRYNINSRTDEEKRRR